MVPTNIHDPTDSALLGDCVRMLSRLVRRAKGPVEAVPALGALSQAAFRTRTCSVRRLAQQFRRLARKKGETAVAAVKATCERQLAIAKASVRQAKQVEAALQGAVAPAAARTARPASPVAQPPLSCRLPARQPVDFHVVRRRQGTARVLPGRCQCCGGYVG